MTTIQISEKTSKNFSIQNLEKFVNSEDFEDIVLWYQMIKWKTWKTESFSSFKKDLWLYKSMNLLKRIFWNLKIRK